jgi:hypothetical protein
LKPQQPKQRDCCTQLLWNEFQHLNFQTAGRESQVLLQRAQKELGANLDPLERTRDKLSRLYLNVWIGHVTQDIGLFSSSAQIWEDGFVVAEMTVEIWIDLVDFVVTKTWPELKTLKIEPLRTSNYPKQCNWKLQNMSFCSNGVDRVRSLRKIPTWLCLMNLCDNGTSSASFASTFVQ